MGCIAWVVRVTRQRVRSLIENAHYTAQKYYKRFLKKTIFSNGQNIKIFWRSCLKVIMVLSIPRAAKMKCVNFSKRGLKILSFHGRAIKSDGVLRCRVTPPKSSMFGLMHSSIIILPPLPKDFGTAIHTSSIFWEKTIAGGILCFGRQCSSPQAFACPTVFTRMDLST